ncbi:IQ domain-containing protein containing GTPase activating protein [Capronia epimyces CBS 606.96]|uniref:IQ domain-containing protein containing GTPase activating protein n=1 Tax=Capronia epimyces CBS 606.96 TaxID=1182542 RepID=W9X8T7_9EURO|nr:IQ domain-containing protein containing GTPase activating protein [Capronia epimyces CBS 606.96]EXJ76862.1 IQ domain-containing protein containing GTPase activating protein [Capronia epimyces CBS 606.96]
MSHYTLRRAHADNHYALPQRQASTTSTVSSAYSAASSAYLPSRTSTVTSTNSSVYSTGGPGHKRGISDAGGMTPTRTYGGHSSAENSPDNPYRHIRQSLRALPQPPSPKATPNARRPSGHHARAHTVDRFPQNYSEDPTMEKHLHEHHNEMNPSRPHLHHALTSPHATTFKAPDIEELQKSSTSHLRTLSRFAKDGDAEEFGIAAAGHSVVGLHNRRQLKRTDPVAQGGRTIAKSYGWGERNWMDKQRQFLQAYEYLCHVGEAKEWIEDIISKPIPPVVELEEALRNGVTLAEIVQAFHPDQTLRIFRHPKLQYKHSDNIVLFFRFLEEVGLPDLFRFELIDLYEKKNIPKVIYCIHALSWLLYRKGMVDFRIGNLVGQLEFEHHELEQTQRGLDKAGVSMPSFSGMGASFGAEPEPEPVEKEEDRIDRELHEQEAVILDFQNQIRGALVRLRLGTMMQQLWDSEESLIELQSHIRADWARQILGYRLDMQRFATRLQAVARGFIERSNRRRKEEQWRGSEKDVLKLQSLFRAGKARTESRTLKSQIRTHDAGIRSLQAAIRGALSRRDAFDQYEATRTVENEVVVLQAKIRGMLARARVQRTRATLERQTQAITHIQACVRSMLTRISQDRLRNALHDFSVKWTTLQAVARAGLVRQELARLMQKLQSQSASVSRFQAILRGANTREAYSSLRLSLLRQSTATIPVQAAIRSFLLRSRLKCQKVQLARYTSQVVQLQAMSRGAILRLQTAETLSKLDSHQDQVVHLQACARAMLCRITVADLLGDLDEHQAAIIQLQAFIRATAIRSRFAEKRRHFKENMDKVVKIQSVVRAKIQGKAYKSLTSGKNPPVGTLKGFVHLLNDSDFDFEEEIEFERLRKTVVQHVRQNELADQYITQLDIKIALLVKNKITLDEVVKHQRHFGGHVGALLPNSDIASKDPFDLKALNKTSRRKLEHYQELFFLLQTQPQYLSRLFRRIREQATAEKECDRIKHLVMGLFGYAQKRREEYYLVKLIVRSIKEEVDCSLSLQDYLRTNSFSNKLFAAYSRSARDRKFLRDVLGPLVKENIIDNTTLDLESDPLQIYLSAINNEELRTGRRSQRDPNVPREVAIRDPETRSTFIAHMQDLRDITDQFFLCLEDYLHRMPFGVRFIVQQTQEYLVARFPGEDADFVLQLVGQWLWRGYLQPALVEPEKFGVADRALTQEQKRNLGEIAKVLNQAASGREFGGDNVYLQPLNNYIREATGRFRTLWSHVVSIPTAEEHYDIDEFNDLYAKTKPTLYVKMSDIFSIHKLLSQEISTLCPSQDDVLRDILRELGSAQSNESELRGVSSGEISLTLTPKLLSVEDPDSEVKALFTETKRCVLYIIRVQSGANLLEILVKPISQEDEDKWEVLVQEELHPGSKRHGAYADGSSHLDISALSYRDLKRIALENVLHLESMGRLTRTNHYQDLLNAIAVDIRTKHRRRLQRQRELENVRTTLARLNEQAVYLEQQLKTYNDYIEQAMVTLQNKKGKKRFVMPFTKQWDHERELQRSGRSFKFGSYKYSARTLADKGVLVHWRGYNERQWDRVDLTISSNEVGVFTIDGSSGNMMIPGANAQVPLDDLLQAQFNNTQFLEFFEGALRVNVNLFLHLIMKKFYNE